MFLLNLSPGHRTLPVIPCTARKLEFGPRESSRDSTIINGSIFLISKCLQPLDPRALARSKFQVSSRAWYRKYLQALLYFTLFAGAEPLLATTYTVNSTADTNTGSGTSGTLRYCINQSNIQGGSNSIGFSVASGTITLVQPLPPVISTINSISSSNAITIDGSGLYQPFFVESGATLTIGSNIAVINGASIGGNGAAVIGGGGGALGAGGGLFVANNANATIQGGSFSNCKAVGGNGGFSEAQVGNSGGGGGMNGGAGGIGLQLGGGGGGGYGSAGGGGGANGGGGGGGLFFSGGNADYAGGGGGSDAQAGASASGGTSGNGGNGGEDFQGNLGGAGGSSGSTGGAGGMGEGLSGGGGGGYAQGSLAGGSGGNSSLGGGGGGGSDAGNCGNGGDSTGSFGGGGGGGSSNNAASVNPGNGGHGGNYGGGGGVGTAIYPGGGGNGGFGGGGGGASPNANMIPMAGNGGFGAGGGGGYQNITSGQGGFGAANGLGGGFAGSGAALGGTFFIGNGGTLTILDHFQASITSGTSQGGTGQSSAQNGQALGPDIFLMSGGTINFNQSTPFTINTAIASDNGAGGGSTTTGGIIMSGSGVLTLGGANTYTGSTTLNAGTVQISDDTNLGNAANPVNFNGGTLEFTASTALNAARNLNLNGPGTIQSSQNQGIGLSGVINGGAGSPLTIIGPGTFYLYNTANAYSGGTVINSAILEASENTQFGSGTVTLNDGSLYLSLPATSVVPNAIVVDGLGSIKCAISEGNEVTFSGGVTAPSSSQLTISMVNSGTVTFSGVITDAISLDISGTSENTVILSGSNSYTGTTTIEFGVLEIDSDEGLPSSSNVQMFNQAGLVFNTSANYSGNISGSGPVTVQNGGVLILSGTNTYNTEDVGTTVTSGSILQINTSSSFPSAESVTDNGSLIFNYNGLQTYSGNISGRGALTVQGGADITLSGSNTYSNGTTIATGSTLQINTPSSLPSVGAIANNGSLIFDYTSAGIGSVSGLISGNGNLIMQGSGTLQLTNPNNSYLLGTNLNSGIVQVFANGNLGTGPLTFNGGILEISESFLSSQPVTLNASGGTVQVNNGQLGTLIGAIGGGGDLTIAGPGTLALSAVNDYNGTTIVQSGSLVVDLGGSITSPMQLTIQSGSVFVNGAVTSPILVNSGGTLSGTGTVGSPNNAVTVNGTISAGGINTVGTLIGSDFILDSSSTYLVNIDNTAANLIASTGTVTIDGGILQINPIGFTAPALTSYPVITAPMIITNTPFTLVNPLTRYLFTIEYDPTTSVLLALQEMMPFHKIITKGNPGAVAVCFDALVEANPADLKEVIDILDLETPSQITHSLNQMQPANFNTIYLSEENVAERMRQVYSNHFSEQRGGSCPDTQTWRVWTAPFAERVRQHGNGQLPGYLERFAGFSTALDYQLQKHWMFTGGFSFASSTVGVPHARTNANFQTYAGTLGVAWTDSSFFANLLISYLYSSTQAKRRMHFAVDNSMFTAEVNRTATHHSGSSQILEHLGGGYYFKLKATEQSTFNLSPFANVDYIYIPQNSYKEHGAKSLDLKVHNKSYDLLRPEVGLGVGYQGCFPQIQVGLDLAVSYVGEFRFLGKKTKAEFQPTDCTFTVTGLKPQNNLVSPSARLRLASPTNGYSLTLGYHGEYGKHFILNAGEVEFRKSF
jgi:autotransporter-associated beta strand protein